MKKKSTNLSSLCNRPLKQSHLLTLKYLVAVDASEHVYIYGVCACVAVYSFISHSFLWFFTKTNEKLSGI